MDTEATTPSKAQFSAWKKSCKDSTYPIDDETLFAIQEYLTASDSPQEVISRIASHCHKPREKTPFREIWFVLRDAVDRFSGSTERLASLIVDIRRWSHDPSVSSDFDIAELGDFLCDFVWFDGNYVWGYFTGQERADIIAKWINQNAFLACLTSKSNGVERLNFLGFAESCMGTTLERTPWDPQSRTWDPEPDMDRPDEAVDGQMENRAAVILNVQVPAAWWWMHYCGDMLYGVSMAGGKLFMEYEDNGTDWGAVRGHSLERWAYWQRRFREIADMSDLSSETRRVAGETADFMEEITKRHTGSREESLVIRAKVDDQEGAGQ